MLHTLEVLQVYSLSLHLERSDYCLERSDYLVERKTKGWNEVVMERSDRNSNSQPRSNRSKIEHFLNDTQFRQSNGPINTQTV